MLSVHSGVLAEWPHDLKPATESTKVLDQPCPCSMYSPHANEKKSRAALPQTGRKAKAASKTRKYPGAP